MEVSHPPVQFDSVQYDGQDSPCMPPSASSCMAVQNGDHLARIHDSQGPPDAHESLSKLSMDKDGIEEPMSTKNTPCYDEMIEILPADIRLLCGAYRERLPLRLFCSTWWPFLPVELPAYTRYVFLGLFNISHIEVSDLCRVWDILIV